MLVGKFGNFFLHSKTLKDTTTNLDVVSHCIIVKVSSNIELVNCGTSNFASQKISDN